MASIDYTYDVSASRVDADNESNAGRARANPSETQAGSVNAQGVGADTYKADPTAPRDRWMENNRNWINDRMDERCTIIDCGPAAGRANYPSPTSPYYQMELDEIAKRGYTNYIRVFLE